MKNDFWLVPLIFFCMFFVPLFAFLGASIYVAKQPINVHKIVAECFADPACIGQRR